MSDSRLVYSTATGRLCPHCGKARGRCTCKKKRGHATGHSAADPADGIVRIRRETQGRKGKTVTTIHGLALAQSDLVGLARRLKSGCGAGGTLKDGVIVIQGDHRQALLAQLREQGFTVKLSGG